MISFLDIIALLTISSTYAYIDVKYKNDFLCDFFSNKLSFLRAFIQNWNVSPREKMTWAWIVCPRCLKKLGIGPWLLFKLYRIWKRECKLWHKSLKYPPSLKVSTDPSQCGISTVICHNVDVLNGRVRTSFINMSGTSNVTSCCTALVIKIRKSMQRIDECNCALMKNYSRGSRGIMATLSWLLY